MTLNQTTTLTPKMNQITIPIIPRIMRRTIPMVLAIPLTIQTLTMELITTITMPLITTQILQITQTLAQTKPLQ